MQCSVSVTVAMSAAAGVGEWERHILAAGRSAMRQALGQAVRAYEDAHAACPHCGGTTSQSAGTVRRRVLTAIAYFVSRCEVCFRHHRQNLRRVMRSGLLRLLLLVW